MIGNHTGMTIYSGLDADAIDNSQLNPNDEITELLLQLKAPFRTTPDTSCAPNCPAPPQPIDGNEAHCKFAKQITDPLGARPRRDLAVVQAAYRDHSQAAAAAAAAASGLVLASGAEKNGQIRLRVNTRLLPTNRVSRPAVVYSNIEGSGIIYFKLKVDNTPPRLLSLRTRSTGGGRRVSFRVSEKSHMRIAGSGPRYRHWVSVPRRRLFIATLPSSVHQARLILRDRAGNTVARKLTW